MKVIATAVLLNLLALSHACKEQASNKSLSVTQGKDNLQASSKFTTAAPSTQPFLMETRTADSCRGGYEFQFNAMTSSQARKFEFTVHHLEKAAYPDEAFDAIAAKIPSNSGRRLVGVINAGFFDEGNGAVYSFFQSAPPWLQPADWRRSPNKGTLPKPRSAGVSFARPCLEWPGLGHLPRYFVPGTPSDRQEHDTNHSSNILCAGPMLLENASSGSDSRSLNEQLMQSAAQSGLLSQVRADGKDPVAFAKKQARAASCIKQNGDFLLFATFPNSCGLSLPDLQTKLFALGCKTALAHDGGTSVQYTFFSGPGRRGKQSTTGRFAMLSRHRKVPVWLAVSLVDQQ